MAFAFPGWFYRPSMEKICSEMSTLVPPNNEHGLPSMRVSLFPLKLQFPMEPIAVEPTTDLEMFAAHPVYAWNSKSHMSHGVPPFFQVYFWWQWLWLLSCRPWQVYRAYDGRGRKTLVSDYLHFAQNSSILEATMEPHSAGMVIFRLTHVDACHLGKQMVSACSGCDYTLY